MGNKSEPDAASVDNNQLVVTIQAENTIKSGKDYTEMPVKAVPQNVFPWLANFKNAKTIEIDYTIKNQLTGFPTIVNSVVFVGKKDLLIAKNQDEGSLVLSYYSLDQHLGGPQSSVTIINSYYIGEGKLMLVTGTQVVLEFNLLTRETKVLQFEQNIINVTGFGGFALLFTANQAAVLVTSTSRFTLNLVLKKSKRSATEPTIREDMINKLIIAPNTQFYNIKMNQILCFTSYLTAKLFYLLEINGVGTSIQQCGSISGEWKTLNQLKENLFIFHTDNDSHYSSLSLDNLQWSGLRTAAYNVTKLVGNHAYLISMPGNFAIQFFNGLVAGVGKNLSLLGVNRAVYIKDDGVMIILSWEPNYGDADGDGSLKDKNMDESGVANIGYKAKNYNVIFSN